MEKDKIMSEVLIKIPEEEFKFIKDLDVDHMVHDASRVIMLIKAVKKGRCISSFIERDGRTFEEDKFKWLKNR